MKKLLLSVAAVLLLGLAYYGEKPLLTQNSLPEMEEFYNESLHLDQMSPDSVDNYIIKVPASRTRPLPNPSWHGPMKLWPKPFNWKNKYSIS